MSPIIKYKSFIKLLKGIINLLSKFWFFYINNKEYVYENKYTTVKKTFNPNYFV